MAIRKLSLDQATSSSSSGSAAVLARLVAVWHDPIGTDDIAGASSLLDRDAAGTAILAASGRTGELRATG